LNPSPNMYFPPARRGKARHQAIGALAPETELQVGAVQVVGGALVGALVGGFVRHPMLGAVVGGAAGAAAMRTPITIWIALQLQKAGLLYLPAAAAPTTGGA